MRYAGCLRAMTKLTRLLSAATFCLLAFAGARASAQSCNADTDCPQSYACVVSGTSTAPACKGTGCPADAAAPEPVVYKSCEPKACASDAECGTGMVCYEYKTTSCSGGGGSVVRRAPRTRSATPVRSSPPSRPARRPARSFARSSGSSPAAPTPIAATRFVCQPSVSGGCGSSGRAVSAGPNGTAGATSSGASSSPPAADAGAPECQTTTSFPGSCTPKATTCTGDTRVSQWLDLHGRRNARAGHRRRNAGVRSRRRSPRHHPRTASTRAARRRSSASGRLAPASPRAVASTWRRAWDDATPGIKARTRPSPGVRRRRRDRWHDGRRQARAPDSSGGGCAIAPARAGDSALMLLGLATVGLALVRRRRAQVDRRTVSRRGSRGVLVVGRARRGERSRPPSAARACATLLPLGLGFDGAEAAVSERHRDVEVGPPHPGQPVVMAVMLVQESKRAIVQHAQPPQRRQREVIERVHPLVEHERRHARSAGTVPAAPRPSIRATAATVGAMAAKKNARLNHGIITSSISGQPPTSIESW